METPSQASFPRARLVGMDLSLHPIEVRVLGALLEKEITTPEYYPLSLNALINACNQKSNRDPVVNFDQSVWGAYPFAPPAPPSRMELDKA